MATSAGASSASGTSVSLTITKDDKVKFLRAVHEVAQNNIPTSKDVVFENKFTESDIVWINTQMQEMKSLFDVYMFTLDLSHSITFTDKTIITIICSEKTPINKTKLICEDIEYLIEHLDGLPNGIKSFVDEITSDALSKLEKTKERIDLLEKKDIEYTNTTLSSLRTIRENVDTLNEITRRQRRPFWQRLLFP